jgi:hypothetical protein
MPMVWSLIRSGGLFRASQVPLWLARLPGSLLERQDNNHQNIWRMVDDQLTKDDCQ